MYSRYNIFNTCKIKADARTCIRDFLNNIMIMMTLGNYYILSRIYVPTVVSVKRKCEVRVPAPTALAPATNHLSDAILCHLTRRCYREKLKSRNIYVYIHIFAEYI